MSKSRLWSAIGVLGSLALVAEAPASPRLDDAATAAIEVGTPALTVVGELDVVPPVAKGAGPTRQGNPLWAVPMSTLSATRERPLFSASRRPPPPVAAAAPAPPPPPPVEKPAEPEKPPFSLVGTVIGQDARIGIFLDEASKTTTRIREGESDAGWILRSVDPRSAVMEGSDHMVTLNLPEPGTVEAQAIAGTPFPAGPNGGVPRLPGFGKRRLMQQQMQPQNPDE